LISEIIPEIVVSINCDNQRKEMSEKNTQKTIKLRFPGNKSFAKITSILFKTEYVDYLNRLIWHS